jgi:hypothetical protein
MTTEKKVKYYSYATTFVAIIFILDFLLPKKLTHEKVQEMISYQQSGSKTPSNSWTNFGIKTLNSEIPISKDLFSVLKENDTIAINRTALLSIVYNAKYGQTVYSTYSIYNFYCLFPLLLLITSLWIIVSNKNENDDYLKPLALNFILLVALLSSMILNRYI